MNKSALVFSAFLSAIVLTIMAGVIYTVRGAEPAQVEQQTLSSDPVIVNDLAVAVDPVLEQEIKALEQEIRTREAAYQELISQANARLAEQQAVVTQVNAPAASTSILQITGEEAAVFASRYLGKSQVYSVEAINFNGEVVYMVTFSNGDVVYVSLYGDILGLEEAPRQFDSGQTVANNVGHDDDHDEHDDDD